MHKAGGMSFGRAAGYAGRRLIRPGAADEGMVKKRFDAVIVSGELREVRRRARGIIAYLRTGAAPVVGV